MQTQDPEAVEQRIAMDHVEEEAQKRLGQGVEELWRDRRQREPSQQIKRQQQRMDHEAAGTPQLMQAREEAEQFPTSTLTQMKRADPAGEEIPSLQTVAHEVEEMWERKVPGKKG